MLVLTRKLQETIRIGNNVTITIVRIQGNTVRVGIEAPQDVRVVRGEIATADAPEQDAGHSASAGAAGQHEPLAVEEIDHLLPPPDLCTRMRARQQRRLRRRAAGFDSLV
jgi:carbon storage regulator CsrA